MDFFFQQDIRYSNFFGRFVDGELVNGLQAIINHDELGLCVLPAIYEAVEPGKSAAEGSGGGGGGGGEGGCGGAAGGGKGGDDGGFTGWVVVEDEVVELDKEKEKELELEKEEELQKGKEKVKDRADGAKKNALGFLSMLVLVAKVLLVCPKKLAKVLVVCAKKNPLHFLSMLVLVAMVLVVCCSISEPPVLVWRFSFLLCYSSVICLSLRLDVALSAVIMFLVTFSGFMTALYMDAVLDHEIGALMAHLNSYLAVVMLGYALAKHCQHNGLEVTPATAPAPPEKEQKIAFHTLILGLCYLCVVTALVAVCMAWVVFHRAELATEDLVLLAFAPMSIALLFWSMFLGTVLLRGVFIGEARLMFLGVQVLLVGFLVVVSYVVLGDIGAIMITWLGTLFWTGWFGYSLCVYNSFKQELIASDGTGTKCSGYGSMCYAQHGSSTAPTMPRSSTTSSVA